MQANQQSTTIDTWDYWEFQTYIEILNKKNKQRATQEKAQQDEIVKQQNINTPKLKKPKLK